MIGAIRISLKHKGETGIREDNVTQTHFEWVWSIRRDTPACGIAVGGCGFSIPIRPCDAAPITAKTAKRPCNLLGATIMIQLGQASDGRLILGSNQAMPCDIRYVEYYREQRLISLVFENEEQALMPLEIPHDITAIVETSPTLIIIELGLENGIEPMAYDVPLIQIGL